jgi:hypothetical protein
MDRDDDGVPDYLEDANYADEAPVRGPYRTRARQYYRQAGGPGCAVPLALLLAAASALARRTAGRRRR